jgi:hypothetical protein
MYRLQYRNFGTHQTLVGNHTVDVNGADQAGIHWFEIRNSGAGFAMNQEGVYAPDSDSRWMGSAAMDVSGNIALGYSVSSGTTYPSVRYTGRLSEDPAGTLPQGEATLVAGGGSQTSTSARWGDYSMMAVDPSDGCTFWYTQEYMQTTGSASWQTRIGSFRFPSCSTGPTGLLSGTVTTTSGAPVSGAVVTVTGGYLTRTDINGNYSFRLISGTYDISVVKYGYITATQTGIAISPPSNVTRNFVLSAEPVSIVSGTVRDAATSWPLYARIDIGGYPNGPVFTDPATGFYQVALVAGSYTVMVTAMSGGYDVVTEQLDINGDMLRNYQLSVSSLTCTAPGYQQTINTPFFSEGFDAAVPPALPSGWVAFDTAMTAGDWTTGTVSSHPAGIIPHSSPTMAIFNSYTTFHGKTRLQQTSGLDLSTRTNAEVSYWMYHESEYTEADSVQLQLSTDAGATWVTVGQPVFRSDGSTGWKRHAASITAYTGPGMTDVRIGLLGDSGYGNDIHIDDVAVSPASECTPLPAGGLVIGTVRDANTGTTVLNALVFGADLTCATRIDASADPAVRSLLYVIAQPAGTRTLTASSQG